MAKNQKSYTPEFKQQIVDLYNAGGTSYPQLEREYGVNRSTLSNWVKQLSPIKVSEEETVTLKEYKALQKEIQRLKIENEILKKSDRHIRKRTIAEIVTFIQNHLNHYTVSQLCSALKFPRSTYYKALVRVPSNRQEEYEEFGRKVKQAYDESRQRYGAVKICRTLNNNGTLCSVKRVQRHMEQQGLRSVVVKKYNHHANHGAIPDDKANILKRDFTARTINQKWCTDITYIHVLKEGWTYLASVMDLCSRKIIGYAYGKMCIRDSGTVHTRKRAFKYPDAGRIPSHQPACPLCHCKDKGREKAQGNHHIQTSAFSDSGPEKRQLPGNRGYPGGCGSQQQGGSDGGLWNPPGRPHHAGCKL